MKRLKVCTLLTGLIITSPVMAGDFEMVSFLTMTNLMAPLSLLVVARCPIPKLDSLDTADIYNSKIKKPALVCLGSTIASTLLTATLYVYDYRNTAIATATLGNLTQIGCFGCVGYQRYKQTMERKQQETRLLELVAQKERSQDENKEINKLIKKYISTK